MDIPTDHAALAMECNNKTMRDNLYHLKESIKCARQSNWYGVRNPLASAMGLPKQAWT
jgi:hypothetical protein